MKDPNKKITVLHHYNFNRTLLANLLRLNLSDEYEIDTIETITQIDDSVSTVIISNPERIISEIGAKRFKARLDSSKNTVILLNHSQDLSALGNDKILVTTLDADITELLVVLKST